MVVQSKPFLNNWYFINCGHKYQNITADDVISTGLSILA